MKQIEHYWYRTHLPVWPPVWLLLPLSWLFCFIAVFRRKIYRLNLKKSFATHVPVVVIGNIVVGGSGKTPLLISLCEYIQKNGFKPGVVSRGYGGSVTGVKQVVESDSAELVGDEPLMVQQRTNVPVVVGADRVAAIDYLLKNNQCDIVLSDDGLQHYRMKRDLEIAVVDSQRKFGNGFCLPAGPLRERMSRLNDVDIVVYNGATTKTADDCLYTLQIASVNKLNSGEVKPLSSFVNSTVHAVAGIGHPARFFEQLRKLDIEVIEHAFPDHHGYQQSDFDSWHQDCILMTEKDAVKCQHLLLPDTWVVMVEADLSDVLESRLSSSLLPLLN